MARMVDVAVALRRPPHRRRTCTPADPARWRWFPTAVSTAEQWPSPWGTPSTLNRAGLPTTARYGDPMW